LALAIGGPIHLLIAHAPANQTAAHGQTSACHDHHGNAHQHEQRSESHDGPLQSSSDECSLCVLLAIGATLNSDDVLSVDRPSLYAAVSVDSLELTATDQQLPAARAPPAFVM
jgi:hypothetical protein